MVIWRIKKVSITSKIKDTFCCNASFFIVWYKYQIKFEFSIFLRNHFFWCIQTFVGYCKYIGILFSMTLIMVTTFVNILKSFEGILSIKLEWVSWRMQWHSPSRITSKTLVKHRIMRHLLFRGQSYRSLLVLCAHLLFTENHKDQESTKIFPFATSTQTSV